jgi:hypothetical protein
MSVVQIAAAFPQPGGTEENQKILGEDSHDFTRKRVG